MAKLNARGRKELLRIEREINETSPESSTTWQRTTLAVMSDGKVLEKWDVRFKPSTYEQKPGIYSYGWKLKYKAKPGVTPESVRDLFLKRTTREEKPWTLVSGALKPVILSAARITRAIESGQHIGFCKSCGHSQDGCEPDARNYRCESCGAMDVYGAEECLMGL